MTQRLRSLFVGAFSLCAASATSVVFGWNIDEGILDVNEAFQVVQPHWTRSGLELGLRIAPNTFVYKDKVHVDVEFGSERVATHMSGGVPIHDAVFGDTTVYPPGDLLINVPMSQQARRLPGSVTFKYQGCNSSGVCYPPQTRVFALTAGPSK